MMLQKQIRRSALVVLLWSALSHPPTAQAQIPGLETAKSPPPSEEVVDPLGRTTPRSTIKAFMRAMERNDLVSAARHMQLTESQRPSTEALGHDLKGLMDRYLSVPIMSISDSPDGALDDGLPIDLEHVGPLTIGDKKTDITLVRVADPEVGPIWLISSETLAEVPALQGSATRTWIERVMPQSLVNRKLFGISLAHWIVLAASLVIPFILLALISAVFIFLAKRVFRDPARRRDLDAWYAGIQRPAITLLALVIHLTSMRFLGFPVTFRIAYARVGLVVAVIALTWLIRRVLTLGFERTRSMLRGKDRTSMRSLLLLGERLAKTLVVMAAILVILTIAGVDTKTALAGLGIGGVALALGAQKTVENFLGGVFLLSDRALAVGDTCSIGDRVGVVEDITLRSVRLRTSDQSLLSIPAGALAQTGIENFASRDKILVKSTLRLRYGTSVEQLRRILEGIRTLLDENPKIETGTSRIRLVNFGVEAIELELFAFVLTADVPEFLAVREDLLLEIAAIVEAAGSSFAQPTQFIYMDGGPGADTQLSSSAARDPDSGNDVRSAQLPTTKGRSAAPGS
jgi:MscS family membrane protein